MEQIERFHLTHEFAQQNFKPKQERLPKHLNTSLALIFPLSKSEFISITGNVSEQNIFMQCFYFTILTSNKHAKHLYFLSTKRKAKKYLLDRKNNSTMS